MGAPSERINNVVGTNPKDTVSLHREKLLLGEGPDEVEFLKALASKLEIDGLQIEHYGGKDNLGNYLITLPKIPGYSLLSTIGITRDADDSFSASYESVSNMVRRIGLEVPSTPGEFVTDGLRVGVFIFPNCHSPGIIEDLWLESVSDDPAMPCVNRFIECARAAGCQPSIPSKARAYSWLATRPKMVPPRKAAARGYWPWEAAAFDLLKNFLRQLRNESPHSAAPE